MVDDMVQLIREPHDRPFFMMAWSQQTHHPYEPSPGTQQLSLLREPVPYQYDVDRYLNVLHETDAHLARIFAAVRETGHGRQHADRDHRRPRPGLRVPARQLRAGADDLRRRRQRAADAVVPAAFPDRRCARASSAATSIWRRRLPTWPACRPRPDWRGRSLLDTSRRAARVLLRGRGSLPPRRARGRVEVHLRPARRAPRSCIASISTPPSSTTSRPPNARAAPACASVSPRGPRPTVVSTRWVPGPKPSKARGLRPKAKARA